MQLGLHIRIQPNQPPACSTLDKLRYPVKAVCKISYIDFISHMCGANKEITLCLLPKAYRVHTVTGWEVRNFTRRWCLISMWRTASVCVPKCNTSSRLSIKLVSELSPLFGILHNWTLYIKQGNQFQIEVPRWHKLESSSILLYTTPQKHITQTLPVSTQRVYMWNYNKQDYLNWPFSM